MRIITVFLAFALFAFTPSVNAFDRNVCATYYGLALCAVGTGNNCFNTDLGRCHEVRLPSNQDASVRAEPAGDGKELVFYSNSNCGGNTLATYSETSYDNSACIETSDGDYIRVRENEDKKDSASTMPSLFE